MINTELADAPQFSLYTDDTTKLIKRKEKSAKFNFELSVLALQEMEKATIETAPFGPYKDFGDCVQKNQDKSDPNAYCAVIKKNIEGASVQQNSSEQTIEGHEVRVIKQGPKQYEVHVDNKFIADTNDESTGFRIAENFILKKLLEDSDSYDYLKNDNENASQENSSKTVKTYNERGHSIEIIQGSSGDYSVKVDGRMLKDAYKDIDDAISYADTWIDYQEEKSTEQQLKKHVDENIALNDEGQKVKRKINSSIEIADERYHSEIYKGHKIDIIKSGNYFFTYVDGKELLGNMGPSEDDVRSDLLPNAKRAIDRAMKENSSIETAGGELDSFLRSYPHYKEAALRLKRSGMSDGQVIHFLQNPDELEGPSSGEESEKAWNEDPRPAEQAGPDQERVVYRENIHGNQVRIVYSTYNGNFTAFVQGEEVGKFKTLDEALTEAQAVSALKGGIQ